MSGEGYWLARLRRLQDQVQEHLDAVPSDSIGGSPEYRHGFDSGRRIAYERCLLMIGSLRREWAHASARAVDPSPGGPARVGRIMDIRSD